MRYALGTVQFGIDYGVQGARKPSGEAVYRMLDKAAEAGIDTLDTAAAYGNAESVIGEYLDRNISRKQEIKIISKLAANVFKGSQKKQWSDIAIKHARQSLARLGISRLAAFLFHDASYIFDRSAVKALHAVVDEGVAERIGVSVYTPLEAMRALEYEEIKVIQIPYNVFDRRLDRCGFFKQAESRGVEVYVRSTLLQGLALMDPDKGLSEKMGFAEKYIRKFRRICREYHVSPLEAAVCYAGGHAGISCVVFGVDNERQLEEYISMMYGTLPEGMEDRLAEAFDTVEEKLVNPMLWG